jgi:hypothetical protein
MGLILRPGVSFCRTGGFTFFLDVDRDRYFAIGGDADAGFARIVAGGARADGDTLLVATLVRDGLVVATGGAEQPQRCCHPCPASESAIELADRDRLRPPMVIALCRILAAQCALRHTGLGRTLRRLAARKLRVDGRPAPADMSARIAAAFERCNLLASPLDQCLPRSIAVAHRMLDYGLSPTLLIGVRAQPFAAHCWVESGDLIVTDRHDSVRPFAPILVL